MYKRAMGQDAEFLACLCDDVKPTNYLLTLSCFPTHLQDQVNRRPRPCHVNYQGRGTSEKPLCRREQVFVSFSEEFSLLQSGNEEDLYLL